MIISRTPLRISLFGGGTDFPEYYEQFGGLCISTTIDKYVYVIFKQRDDKRIKLHYSTTEMVESDEDVEAVYHIKHNLIREALIYSDIYEGVEIVTMADIPGYGSGLGSSSAVTAGMLAALSWASEAEYYPRVIPGILAEKAYEIERSRVGKILGKQDQFAVTHGGFNSIHFSEDAIEVKPFLGNKTRRQLQDNLLLFYTGITREADHILSNQWENPDWQTYHCIKDIAEKAQKKLSEGELGIIGKLLDETWAYKRYLSNTSNDTIDLMYDRALGAGALGGKICGAGGGGYLLLYVPLYAQDKVRAALLEYKELPFKFESEGVVCREVF